MQMVSITAKLNEIKILINSQNLDIFCLQESNFTHNSTPKINEFQEFTKNLQNCSRANEGVTIFTDLLYSSQ